MNRLREVRSEANCKMRELAVRAGVSAATLSDIERYQYTPRNITKERIANALGVSITSIWPDEEAIR